MIYHKLAKAGYCGGDLERIREMNPRDVIQSLFYEKFLIDYEEAYFELNKEPS